MWAAAPHNGRQVPSDSRDTQFSECSRLDLADPLDAQPGRAGDLAQGLGGTAEPVVRFEHEALALTESGGQVSHLLDLHAVITRS